MVERNTVRAVAVAAASVLASACGQSATVPPPGAGTHQSGSRLRAQVITTDDGARVFQGRWVDRDLDDMTCRFGLADDGTIRCLPGSSFRRRAYADADCAIELRSYESDNPQCPGTPPTFMTFTTDDEPARTRVTRFGQRYDPGDAIHLLEGDTCTAAVADTVYFAEGETVSASVFAGAQIVESDGRPRAVYWLGADGSYEHAGWENRTTGEPCELHEFFDGETVCIPDGSATIDDVYADAACEVPLATVSSTETSVPTVAYCDACEPAQRLFEVRETFTSATVYLAGDGACTPRFRSDFRSYYVVGAPIDAADLGIAHPEPPSAGPPRIQPAWRYATDEGYTEVSDFFMTDTALAATCFFDLTGDGQLRCIPIGEWSFLGYNDPECTVPAGRFLPAREGAPPPVFPYDFERVDCALRYSYYPLGELLSSGPPYRAFSTGCSPNNATLPHYAVGTERIDPGMFAPAQAVIE